MLTVFYLAGIFGIVAYCYLYAKVLSMSHFGSVRSKDRLFRTMAQSVFAGTIIFIVSSFFTLSILYVFMMGLTWIAFGLLNFAYVRTRQEKLAAEQGVRLHPPVASHRVMVAGGKCQEGRTLGGERDLLPILALFGLDKDPSWRMLSSDLALT